MILENTSITFLEKSNVAAFQDFLLPDEYAQIATGKRTVALGLLTNGLAAGALTGYFSDDITFRISGIYVAMEYRRCGGATKLLTALVDELPEEVCVTAEFTTEDSSSLFAFFEGVGFIPFETDTAIFKTTLKEVYSAIRQYIKPGIEEALSFEEYSVKELRAAANMVEQKNLPVPTGGFLAPGIDRQASSMIMKDGEVKGYLIVERAKGEHITVSGFYTAGNPKVFAGLIYSSSSLLRETCSGNEEIVLPVINKTAIELLKHIVPSAKQLDVAYAKYGIKY